MNPQITNGVGGWVFLEYPQAINAKKIEVQLDPKCFRGNKDLKVPRKT